MQKVLIVEDNRGIAELVRNHLEDQGFATEIAGDGDAALRAVRLQSFDLVVLDLVLPGIDGLEVCRRLRSRHENLPVLILTARSDELDRVLGLELGADDYLVKPFGLRELVARIRAVLRRLERRAGAGATLPRRVEVGDLAIDTGARTVRAAGQALELTRREFDLLLHFVRHPGLVYSRAQLLDLVWGSRQPTLEHTVSACINRLRTKIERDPRHPDYIVTVWGVGYKFRDRAS